MANIKLWSDLRLVVYFLNHLLRFSILMRFGLAGQLNSFLYNKCARIVDNVDYVLQSVCKSIYMDWMLCARACVCVCVLPEPVKSLRLDCTFSQLMTTASNWCRPLLLVCSDKFVRC